MPSDTKHKNRKTSFLKSIQMYFFSPYLSFFCLFISYLVFMINTNENAQISTQSGQFLSSQISTLYWTLCLSVSLFVCLVFCILFVYLGFVSDEGFRNPGQLQGSFSGANLFSPAGRRGESRSTTRRPHDAVHLPHTHTHMHTKASAELARR